MGKSFPPLWASYLISECLGGASAILGSPPTWSPGFREDNHFPTAPKGASIRPQGIKGKAQAASPRPRLLSPHYVTLRVRKSNILLLGKEESHHSFNKQAPRLGLPSPNRGKGRSPHLDRDGLLLTPAQRSGLATCRAYTRIHAHTHAPSNGPAMQVVSAPSDRAGKQRLREREMTYHSQYSY